MYTQQELAELLAMLYNVSNLSHREDIRRSAKSLYTLLAPLVYLERDKLATIEY